MRFRPGVPYMPAYEYHCSHCGHHFDQRQKMSDAPIAACPRCGGAVQRLISGGAGAISKGAGSSASTEAFQGCPSGACGMGGGCGSGACFDN